NPLGARLNAIFSSDIGHFDVPDMTEVVPEAYEMVEKEVATPADFRDFTFDNVVRLFGRANPRFFEGTRVAAAAAAVLGQAPARAAAEEGGAGARRNPNADRKSCCDTLGTVS